MTLDAIMANSVIEFVYDLANEAAYLSAMAGGNLSELVGKVSRLAVLSYVVISLLH